MKVLGTPPQELVNIAPDYGGRRISVRKQLGIFYTPDPLAQLLVEWALHDNVGSVLDPSFGGCSFLRATHEHLGRLEVADRGRLVHGIDIDELGGRRAAKVLEDLGVPRDNFTYSNFLAVKPRRTFSALVGNPPYIRHHHIDDQTKAAAEIAMGDAGVTLSGRASLWASFVIHSSQFLRPNGRLALVLPGSVLQAEYAVEVMNYINIAFETVMLLRLNERLFPDAQEDSVVMLASGHGRQHTLSTTEEVGGVAELRTFLSQPLHLSTSATDELSRRLQTLSLPTRLAWQRASAITSVSTLGEVADVRIGVVTGANDFFVRTSLDPIVSTGASVPVVSRSAWLTSPVWGAADEEQKVAEGKRCRLVTLRIADISESTHVRSEVAKGRREKLHERSHMMRRPAPWWILNDVKAPDAFLRYMGSEFSRIVLNSGSSTCTNAVHRIYWKDASASPAAIVLSSWTSLFGLAVELHGRHYGGGVLKIEPTPAALLPILTKIPRAAHHLKMVDCVARKDGVAAAIAEADRRVLINHLGLSEIEVRGLQDGIARLNARRHHRC